jgi:peptide/nickel transport system substrate-binding protein
VRALEGAIMRQIMEPLVTYDENLDLVPCLAESWEALNGGQQWVFHLKPGITFHSGAPFNADAVVAHFRRIMDTSGSTRKNRIERLREIVALDELTVRFDLNGPFARFPEIMVDPFAHIVCPQTAAELGDSFTDRPVGTGPFIFESWQRRVRITMRRNPDWHGGEINFDRLVFRPIPEQTTRLIELRQGNLDIAEVGWQLVPDLQGEEGITVQTCPSLSVRYIPMNTQKPPFDNLLVRQAANYALNKEEICEYLMNGLATPSTGPLPENLPSYNPDVTRYPYDPDRARALLAEAGHPNGVDVVMWAPSGTGTFNTIAQAAAEDLRQVGIRVTMRTYDDATYWDQFDRYLKPDGTWEATAEGVYDLSVNGWVGGESPFGYLWPLLRTNSYSNPAFYSNTAYDALLEQMLHAIDSEEYDRLVREAQALVAADAPWIFTNHGVESLGLRDWVKGYQISAAGLYDFDGVTIER